MEGLIPMVYRSVKKSKTRRKYECLSSSKASTTYDIADFYVKDDLHHDHNYSGRISSTPAPGDVSGLRGAHHRRYNSVVVDDRRGGGGGGGGGAKPKQQLVRFRSHKMLSCITGA